MREAISLRNGTPSKSETTANRPVASSLSVFEYLLFSVSQSVCSLTHYEPSCLLLLLLLLFRVIFGAQSGGRSDERSNVCIAARSLLFIRTRILSLVCLSVLCAAPSAPPLPQSILATATNFLIVTQSQKPHKSVSQSPLSLSLSFLSSLSSVRSPTRGFK